MSEQPTGVKEDQGATVPEDLFTGVKEEPVPPAGEGDEPEEKLIPLKAKQDEVRKRQEAEKERDYFKGIAQQLAYNQQPVEQEDYSDDDEPISKGDLKKILVQQRYQAEYKSLESKTIESAKKAIEKYKDAPVTYEEALEEARKIYSPKDLDAICMASNPAELLYSMMMQQPVFKDRVNRATTSGAVEQVVDSINKNTARSSTLSSAPGGSTSTIDAVKKVRDMPKDDFNKLVSKVKFNK